MDQYEGLVRRQCGCYVGDELTDISRGDVSISSPSADLTPCCLKGCESCHAPIRNVHCSGSQSERLRLRASAEGV